MRLLTMAMLTLLFGLGFARATDAQVDFSVDKISRRGNTIQIQVRNLGNLRSPSTKLNIYFQDNDTRFVLQNRLLDVQAMNPGGTQTFVMQRPAQDGIVTRNLLVTVKIDPRLVVRESNERNNLLQRVFRLVPKPPTKPAAKLPDLKISSISKRGGKFHVKVINYGDRQSRPCILSTWAVDRQTLKVTKVERYVSAIKIGGSQVLIVDRIPAAKGHMTITSVIDSRKKIPERREDNNRMEKTFASANPVKATADLVVSKIEFQSPTKIEVWVYNQGTTATNRAFRVRMEVFERDMKRRRDLKETETGRLGPKQFRKLLFESKVPVHRPMIVAVDVDVRNVVRETSERNNKTMRVR